MNQFISVLEVLVVQVVLVGLPFHYIPLVPHILEVQLLPGILVVLQRPVVVEVEGRVDECLVLVVEVWQEQYSS